MPEGDTLHRIARRVAPRLCGATVLELRLADLDAVREAVGWRVERVAAVGKHLLVGFDSGWTLRTHLGMHGRVFLTGPGRAAPRRSTFTVVAEQRSSGAHVTVACVRAYRAELVRTRALRSHPRLARLGPDLVRPDVDFDAVVSRAVHPAHAEREIADLLLDQRIAAGIGNVYKSEVLFLGRVHPRSPAGRLGREAVEGLYREASRLLRLNLGTRRRTTVPTRRRPRPDSPRLWVYGRTGEPCLECGTAIERFAQGDMARATWICPTCQEART